MRLLGSPLRLGAYPCESITNRQFESTAVSHLDRIYLPSSVAPLMDEPAVESVEFVEDDNRGAVSPEPVARLDGRAFYLSVKGVGSPIDPYSSKPLDGRLAAELVEDPSVRARLERIPDSYGDRFITGELWLRGSPYGGQGLEHATTALRVSERADLTSIGGFLIAPVIKIALFPRPLEEQLRQVYWYRTYPGRFVQELRLVPSNVRIYFHARNTVGHDIRRVYDLFGLDSHAKALRFETCFLRSTVAMLTLFARTLTFEPARGRYRGLDFQDVWLDKDAVVAPDGSVFFVDLEGIDEVWVDAEEVREKLEDQIFRSLYELMFAYEQIEGERARRFGAVGTRKRHFEGVLRRALRDDPFVRLEGDGRRLEMVIRNKCQEESLVTRFPAVEW
ncbi:MAG TPA: hypothetical protein VK455_05710 [Thermoplasmata archaeon]|nr:hypothetical protein [Thermoplasmata archaeon]